MYNVVIIVVVCLLIGIFGGVLKNVMLVELVVFVF